MLTVQGAMPMDADFKQTLCADIDGFSLHADLRCAADDRQALEQQRRYITRPAQDRRARANPRRRAVVLKLKTPWRDGTTHLVMSPLELMQRLAAWATEGAPARCRAGANWRASRTCGACPIRWTAAAWPRCPEHRCCHAAGERAASIAARSGLCARQQGAVGALSACIGSIASIAFITVILDISATTSP